MHSPWITSVGGLWGGRRAGERKGYRLVSGMKLNSMATEGAVPAGAASVHGIVGGWAFDYHPLPSICSFVGPIHKKLTIGGALWMTPRGPPQREMKVIHPTSLSTRLFS